MKNLDLNKFGVQEMNAGEMRENNGGLFGIDDALLIAVVGAAIYIYNEGPSFVAGFKQGWNSVK